ncbi:hypothetical protein SCP_0903640 [Sparassis crispa]|uniref:DUF4219 domain-containing protein n=1 Tax=Sparassis crispa TaxID=139825 RepID=A0A401GW86_9APHY|nr:hypothetical protein SCP_0903640 [Sparassis crispa]GBE86485.1 hypothetical protein SCP_0903640 [Sparassis crispa]
MSEHDSHILKLIKGNYQWSALMKAHLVAADLWEVVGPEEEELIARGPKGVAVKKKKREQAYWKILMNLSPSQMAFVLGSENPEMHRLYLRKLIGQHLSTLFCHCIAVSLEDEKDEAVMLVRVWDDLGEVLHLF